ncbi:MAG: hypothetical protein M1831_003683 [Alyxoria varia]|nr:MAG: hypothetical protein M1831_003683 [Alyxoria varia]
MSSNVQTLVADIKEYQSQLEVVVSSLENDPGNAELNEIKATIEETISEIEKELATFKKTSIPAPAPTAESPSPPPEPPKWSKEHHPAFQPGYRRPGAPAEPAEEPASPVSYNVNDMVLAKWVSGDKGFYPARIKSITGSSTSPVYHVTFKSYGNSETLRGNDIKQISNESKKRKADDSPAAALNPPSAENNPGVISAAATVNPDLASQAKKEPSKVSDGPTRPPKVPKKVKAKKELEAGKSKWQDFTTKGKFGKGAKKDSMFRTGESVNARVGFTGSGQAMRKDPTRSRHIYQANEEEGSLLSLVLAGDQVPLSFENQVEPIPLLGFGTWNIRDNASDVVSEAIQAGFRHLDCAAVYGNEKEVGKGIEQGLKKTGLKRSDLWITSKLWNNEHDAKRVPAALNQTLSDLGLDYLDLYLMHWPVSSVGGKNEIEYLDTYQSMTHLLTASQARHIGISNFSPHQLHTLLTHYPTAPQKPYAHQLETHPYLPQPSFLAYHRHHAIHVTAYSPLANTNPTYNLARKSSAGATVPPLLSSPLLQEIGEQHGCTAAQVALDWGMSRGTSVVPKSVHAGRIREDLESRGCGLGTQDLERINGGFEVKRFNNPSQGWGVPLFEGLDDTDAALESEGGGGEGSERFTDGVSMGGLWERLWRLFTRHGEL